MRAALKVEEYFMPKDGSEDQKKVIKEAIKEWLTDEKNAFNATIGQWFLTLFITSAIAALFYLMLWSNGWTKK